MRATISPEVLELPTGRQMADILQSCVHCGMCNATCPTYQVRGDELDGPRGRIYLIKSMLEGEPTSRKTQVHLDRCLTCRSCETTCPSGVQYGRLIELARPHLDVSVKRTPLIRLKRWLISQLVPYPGRFRFVVMLGSILTPLLPKALAEMVPVVSSAKSLERRAHDRKMLMLEGCAQSVVAPSINSAASRVLSTLDIGIESPTDAGCCGAVDFHLGNVDGARKAARRNIDAWWPIIEDGAEAILSTSSGCAVMLKEYEHLFDDDPAYAEKAKRVSEMVADPSEHIDPARLAEHYQCNGPATIAFHAPCTMQHATRTHTQVEACLQAVGFELAPVIDAHLCCGSAGSYSLLEADISGELLDRKLIALQQQAPETIASANIGCLMHLARRADVPVQHWLELIDAQGGDG